MPDIRTEALKVMQVWSTPPMDKKKLSFSESLFEWVKQNPDKNAKEIGNHFNQIKESVIATTLKSLVDRGILNRRAIEVSTYTGTGKKEQFIYWATTKVYKTQNKGYSSKYYVKKIKVAKAVEPIHRPMSSFVHEMMAEVATERKKEEMLMKVKFDAEELINTLTLQQAKEVYLVLKSVFR
jgi:predicted transcriptional regulator